MVMVQQFQLTVTSDVSNLGTVADFITQAAEAGGLDDKAAYKVQMAVDEAVTNVIEHAYNGNTEGRIYISCEIRGNEFIVEILDFGQPFNAEKVRQPRIKGPLSRRNIGGLGIFFMKKLMDRVEFSSSVDTGNRVRMMKRIR